MNPQRAMYGHSDHTNNKIKPTKRSSGDDKQCIETHQVTATSNASTLYFLSIKRAKQSILFSALTPAFSSCCHQLRHNIFARSDAHERLDHRVELFLRSCQRTQACSPAQKVGSGYKDARKSFPSSAPSCCALKAFLPRTEILHQNSASYCRVRSFHEIFHFTGRFDSDLTATFLDAIQPWQ